MQNVRDKIQADNTQLSTMLSYLVQRFAEGVKDKQGYYRVLIWLVTEYKSGALYLSKLFGSDDKKVKLALVLLLRGYVKYVYRLNVFREKKMMGMKGVLNMSQGMCWYVV